MDKRFDELSKSLAEGVSRREALKKLGVGLAGGLLAYSGTGMGIAKAAARPMPLATSSRGGYLLVGSYANNCVLRYEEQTGAFVDQFDPHDRAGLQEPYAAVFGPDQNLYVSSNIFNTNPIRPAVLQYNGVTGAFLSVFAGPNVTSPRGLLFGRDGNLYVANGNTEASGDPASVLRFDGKTGAFLDCFVAPNSGGLEHPTYMVFDPDGDLYVGAGHVGAILRYDGATGASKGVFVAVDSGGLDGPAGMAFGSDGNLYVSSTNLFQYSNGPGYPGLTPPGPVLRYQGPSGTSPGAFIDAFIPSGSGGLSTPWGLLFGPNGDLFVASAVRSGFQAKAGTSQVLRYDGRTGASLGVFVSPGNGLKFPTFLMFTETDPTTVNYKP